MPKGIDNRERSPSFTALDRHCRRRNENLTGYRSQSSHSLEFLQFNFQVIGLWRAAMSIPPTIILMDYGTLYLYCKRVVKAGALQ